MKKTHSWKRLLCILLGIVLGLAPLFSVPAKAAQVSNVTPQYITDIGIAYSITQSTAKNLVQRNGFTLIDYDLNKGAGGKYIYMGYKTSTDPARAITGIIFLERENPPSSLTYKNATFYLVGGGNEGNGTGDGVVDLNDGAGGAYIYTYITRDTNYGYPILGIRVHENTSTLRGWDFAPNTSGYTQNMNSGAGGSTCYLTYGSFEDINSFGDYSACNSIVYAKYHYLNSSGNTVIHETSRQLKNHNETYSGAPSASNLTLNGYALKFVGWQTTYSDYSSGTNSPSVSYWDNTDSSDPKEFYARYSVDVKLTYDANGGTGAPASQTIAVRAGSGANSGYSAVFEKSAYDFTISSANPTNTNGCKHFLGWSTNRNASTAEYKANQKVAFKSNTTLYAVWQEHIGDADGICDACGKSTADGIHRIGTAEQLVQFMHYVNSGHPDANAMLTADIDMKGVSWTPMRSTRLYYNTTNYPDSGYTGTFDGRGYVISNLSMITSTTEELTYGLFGTLSGTVKNLGMTNVSYTFPSGIADFRVAGVVGQMLPGSKVENCFVINSNITPGRYIVGGIAASNYGGTISGCYTKKVSISGDDRCGNLVSDTRGDITTSDRVGTVVNCWTDANRVVGTQSVSSAVIDCKTNASDSAFASGEATWALNGKSADGIWKQTCGSGLPAFSGETVYQVLDCDGTTVLYSNTNANVQHDRSKDDGNCTTELRCAHCNQLLTEAKPAHTPVEDDGDCTTRVPCSVCDMTVVAANPYHKAAADDGDCTTGVMCTLCQSYAIPPKSGHSWKDASCNAPQFCAFCRAVRGENLGHTLGTTDLCVVCGETFQAAVEINGQMAHYKQLCDALEAVAGCTDQDGATVTLLRDLEDWTQVDLTASVFILDLNGKTIKAAADTYYLLGLYDCAVTIKNGILQGGENSINADNSTLVLDDVIASSRLGLRANASDITVNSGDFTSTSEMDGIAIGVRNNSALTVNGGSFTGAVGVSGSFSTVVLHGGSFQGTVAYGIQCTGGSLTVDGGSIQGKTGDICVEETEFLLGLNEEGVGANFPEGITLEGITLNEALDSGAVYWQDGKQVTLKDQATELLGGDVAVVNGSISVMISDPELKYSGAGLTLNDDLTIKFKINRETLEGFEAPYAVFAMGGESVEVHDFTVSDGKYVFTFRNIAPHRMNDAVSATLYATRGDVIYYGETVTYSVADYCYNMLNKSRSAGGSELRTLLVDLLNYGAASQLYVGYETDNLVNAKLTNIQKAWGSVKESAWESVMDTKYATVDAPEVQWKGASLILQESIVMRFKIAAESVTGLQVKVVLGDRETVIDSFQETDGGYYVYFNGLNGAELRESVYLTVCRGDVPVSNTVRYSVESYACAQQTKADESLLTLLKAMMKYGDAAKEYVS